jgi:adenylate cyclase
MRLVQDIVSESKGAPLEREAVLRLEAVLKDMFAGGAAPRPAGGYSRREVTILFADLRGFSAIAASYPADVVLGVLNRCFAMMTDIIVRHYGTIDKFMGDGIMAIFYGDPAAPRDHARRALLCAVEMQIAMKRLREQHDGEHVPAMYLGIGVNTGKVMAGLIGSEAYQAYTVIGEEVNLASRIEAFSLRGQVLMSEATYAHCWDFVYTGKPMDAYVKGRAEPVRIREVLEIPGLGKVVPRQDLRSSPRVSVKAAMDYWTVESKVVQARAARGAIYDIGYQGVLAELERPLPLYAELKLAFDLPGLDYRAEEIYARVVSIREKNGRPLAGVEFTSLREETGSRIRRFVQTAIQNQVQPG